MRYRDFGRTGLKISELGFGCGAVGGLMVRGEHRDMVRTVAYAIEHGVNYFDTARMYGDGLSEMHIGAVLRELDASDALVGTKVRFNAADFRRLESATAEQIDNSLKRLGRDSVDIIFTHNPIGQESNPQQGVLSVSDIERVASAFESAIEQGKLRFWGVNGLGESDAIHKAVESLEPWGMHTCYNLLNPSSGYQAPASFPFQDYRQLMRRAAERGVGTVGIRVLAGGALSGSGERHPIAASSVGPIATGRSYEEDVARTGAFRFLVQDGYADNLVEAAIRFAISNDSLSTALVGISSFEQWEQAVDSANKGPLPQEALERLEELWAAM
ncbi:MAG: aldo/keto reductase [Chloroflexi bacterium]|nr:aldo/keto reductase [Chloroflexota bacterium]